MTGRLISCNKIFTCQAITDFDHWTTVTLQSPDVIPVMTLRISLNNVEGKRPSIDKLEMSGCYAPESEPEDPAALLGNV